MLYFFICDLLWNIKIIIKFDNVCTFGIADHKTFIFNIHYRFLHIQFGEILLS